MIHHHDAKSLHKLPRKDLKDAALISLMNLTEVVNNLTSLIQGEDNTPNLNQQAIDGSMEELLSLTKTIELLVYRREHLKDAKVKQQFLKFMAK